MKHVRFYRGPDFTNRNHFHIFTTPDWFWLVAGPSMPAWPKVLVGKWYIDMYLLKVRVLIQKPWDWSNE